MKYPAYAQKPHINARYRSFILAVFAFVMLFQMFELTLSYRSTQPLRRCLQFMPVE